MSDKTRLTREIVHSDGEMPSSLDYREDFFPDGTSYVSEFWYADQVSLVTYYFKNVKVKSDEDAIEEYLISVGKLKRGETHHVEVMELHCSAGIIHSVTVAIGDEDDTFCEAEM